MIVLTQEEFNALFTKYPQVRKAKAGEPCCPYCSNALSPENLVYYNQATEAGTPCCTIEISCDVCNKVIWRGGSWYPQIDDREELLEVAQEVLDERIEEHNGDLGDRYSVAWHYNDINIQDQGAEFVALTPKQALSLLAWLEQEREKLERLEETK